MYRLPFIVSFYDNLNFFNEEEVMNAVVEYEYFDRTCAAYFRCGIFKLFHRREKCINLNVDYIEKYVKLIV
jgi:hypothetical protein